MMSQISVNLVKWNPESTTPKCTGSLPALFSSLASCGCQFLWHLDSFQRYLYKKQSSINMCLVVNTRKKWKKDDFDLNKGSN